jgi:hypothetical protein
MRYLEYAIDRRIMRMTGKQRESSVLGRCAGGRDRYWRRLTMLLDSWYEYKILSAANGCGWVAKL